MSGMKEESKMLHAREAKLFLPLAPFLAFVKRYVEMEKATRQALPAGVHRTGMAKPDEDICDDIGVSARTLYRWEHEGQTTVHWNTVDRILTKTNYHWWDIWGEDEYPEVHERLSAL